MLKKVTDFHTSLIYSHDGSDGRHEAVEYPGKQDFLRCQQLLRSVALLQNKNKKLILIITYKDIQEDNYREI